MYQKVKRRIRKEQNSYEFRWQVACCHHHHDNQTLRAAQGFRINPTKIVAIIIQQTAFSFIEIDY